MSKNTHGGAFIVRDRAQLLEGAASATVKALLRDDSVTVRSTGYEAAYDPANRTVHVPAFSMRQDDDPRLHNTFRGTLDQTCARVAFTDYDALTAAVSSWTDLGVDKDAQARLKALVEVFETARIEKSWGKRNPGSVKFMADMHAYWGEKTGGATATDPATVHPSTKEPIGVFGALLQGIARLADGTLKLADMHPVTAQLMQMVADEIVAGLAATSTTEAANAAGAVLRKLAEPPPPPEEDKKDEEKEDQSEEQDPDDGNNEEDKEDEPSEGEDGQDEPDEEDGDDSEEGEQPDNDDDETDGDGSDEGGDSDENEDSAGEDGEKNGDGPGDCEDSGSESDDSDEPGEDGPGDDEKDNDDTDSGEEEDGEGSDGDGEEDEESDEGAESDEDGEGDEEDGDDSEEGEADDKGDNRPGAGAPPSLGQDGGDSGLVWGEGLPDDDGEPAVPVSLEPGEGPLGAGPPGAGVGMAVAAESAVEALGGDWGELPTAGELVASEVLRDPERRPYTVHPDARALDTWERFDAKQREAGKKVVKGLRGAGTSAVAYLSNNLRDVLAATKQTLHVGGLDDGEDLDEEALPGVALGLPSSSIYADTFSRFDDNAFVMVLVDCSGSMGTSSPTRFCPRHGAIGEELDHWQTCQKRDGGTTRCGQPLKYKVSSKAGYAAVAALALHESLRLTNVPHAVLGYTTGYGAGRGDNPTTPAGHPMWSRMRCSNHMKVFVEAPGLNDDGSALPYITGSGANLDGEALKEAAVYAAKNAGEADRIVVIVVSDGLPSAADDSPMNNIQLKRTVEEVASAGIEVYGVGIGIHPKVYSQFFPELPSVGSRAATGYVTLEQNAVGLSAAVLGRLVRILGKSVGYSRGA